MASLCRLSSSSSSLLWFPLVRALACSASCGSLRSVHTFHRIKRDSSNGRSGLQGRSKNSNKHKKDPVEKAVYMRDVVTEIYNVLRYSTWDSAQDRLRKLPVKWDSFTVNRVLKAHPPMEKAWLFFNWAAGLNGFKHDQYTYTTMLDIFGEAGRVSSMRFVFEQMREKCVKIDAVTYTSLMHWVSDSGDVDGAIRVWEEMKANGCNPTVVSYTAFMQVLFRDNRAKEAIDAYKEMLRSGLSPNCHTYTVLMEYLIGSGKCKEALEIFGKMQDAKVLPDKAACNILVEKLSKSRETRALSPILEYMKENRIVLRYPVFIEALEALRASGESDILLRQVNPHCSDRILSDDPDTENEPLSLDEGLVMILLKKHNLLAVDCLLSKLAEENTRLRSSVICAIVDVNCERLRPDAALRAYEYSLGIGTTLQRNSYTALLGASIRSSLFPKVPEIIDEMIKAGCFVGVYLASILIYKLGLAKKPKCAARLFNLLPSDHKCCATYTALIGAYLFAGNIEKGLEVFREIKRSNVLPSLGTYNLVLTSLSRSGRACEFEDLRKEKKSLEMQRRSCDFSPFEDKICDLIYAGQT